MELPSYKKISLILYESQSKRKLKDVRPEKGVGIKVKSSIGFVKKTNRVPIVSGGLDIPIEVPCLFNEDNGMITINAYCKSQISLIDLLVTCFFLEIIDVSSKELKITVRLVVNNRSVEKRKQLTRQIVNEDKQVTS